MGAGTVFVIGLVAGIILTVVIGGAFLYRVYIDLINRFK